jgi:hypothetical protein
VKVFMNFRDSNQDQVEVKYVSKRVMINGQFVTLYSANGQTWLSSPEDIPALMERLDNARVTLNTAEKVAEGEAAKVAEPESKPKKETQEAPERVLSTKYRIKGPKPRPILRQDGVVIKGTPVEPISASSTLMSFSSDVPADEPSRSGGKEVKSPKSAKAKDVKLIAPVISKKVTKASAKAASAAGKSGVKGSGKAHATAVAASTSKVVQAAKQVVKASQPAKQSKFSKAAARKTTKKVAAAKGAKGASKPARKSAKGPKRTAMRAKRAKK